MNNNLITKYRPETWDEVIGQAAVVRSLQTVVKKRDAQIFLFTGPKGTGKTTLSRLVAKAYGCEDNTTCILEIDGATFTGIESMRNVQEMLRYRPFGGSGQRAIILDEAHGLSKNAFDSLLKTLEEPPKHLVWCFCTTNPSKLPETIKSRCAKYELKLVSDKDLGDLFDDIVQQEHLTIPDDVVDIIIREAKGSPRQLISNIVVVRTARTKKEAAELLKAAVETDATKELCQLLTFGNASWSKAMGILNRLEGENPESLRIVISNYLSKAAIGAKDNDKAIYLLQKLEAFSEPYTSYDGLAPLVLSIGRALFADS